VPKDLTEQEAVSNAISSLDKAVRATQKAIVSAEHLQNGLMLELLSGRITAAGTVRPEIEFVDDGRGALPRTWSRARIKDFGEVSTGKTPPTEVAAHFLGEIPFITPGDMGNTKWLSKSERRLSDSGAKLVGKLPAKTVCVVCIGATIGKVGLTDRPSATNQQISSVICSDQHSPEYLYYAIRFFSRHIAAIAGVNATPQLNKSEFCKVKIPMPADLEEEEAIAGRLSELDDLIDAKRSKIIALQRLKKSLMQNLLTGRMRLSPEAIAELTAEPGKSGGA
jgi:type I restriction enzyme S subunit